MVHGNILSEVKADARFHRKIMRSIWIMRVKYFIFGLLAGAVLVFVGMAWQTYNEMNARGGWAFLQAMAEVAQIDYTLLAEFLLDANDLLPVNNLIFGLVLLIILLILILIIWRFRKPLFLKAEKNI